MQHETFHTSDTVFGWTDVAQANAKLLPALSTP